MREGLRGCDVVMMLRLQLERMEGAFAPSPRENFRFWGLDREKLGAAADHVKVMHPGPMNRGVEIDSDVADDLTVSLIQDQVEMGVAARMAILAALAALNPGARESRILTVEAALTGGDAARAVELARGLEAEPLTARIAGLLARAAFAAGRPDEARVWRGRNSFAAIRRPPTARRSMYSRSPRAFLNWIDRRITGSGSASFSSFAITGATTCRAVTPTRFSDRAAACRTCDAFRSANCWRIVWNSAPRSTRRFNPP
jgi:hypothetical protein